MFGLTTSLIFNSIFGYATEANGKAAVPTQLGSSVSQMQQLTLMHGISFESPVNVSQYYVSEKLDGVRAYWDGRHLWSRTGLLIKAPEAITRELPAVPLDGELWLGRGNFGTMSGLIHSNNPSQSSWDQVSFAIFDLPSHGGNFAERYEALKHLFPLPEYPSQTYPVFVIPQTTLSNEQQLLDYLAEVVKQGGEGLMLHKQSNAYTFGRTSNVLKLKPAYYSSATVIGYKPGSGKYEGKIGALHVRNTQGIEYYVGSGLTDNLRETPPEIGSLVCVKHSGLTVNQKPRFPRYSKLCE
ncbi:DNA ligase [Aliidiomarina taiwanensis]|uniref:DNA ligase n=1 Tax=Aliidiomarina taiwanensis TaxID=946228 RepID=A0A432X094_9GAMM|nr:DNA ligase [Aliidiomarina taiwanensis]RUO39398.1 DNA ligase [Aliidiomarina taiwanensis]